MSFPWDLRHSCVVGGYVYLEDNPEVFGFEFLWRWETVVWRSDGKPGNGVDAAY